MSAQIKDGGQAFPVSGYEGESTMSSPVPGMTLRDYFAAKAMQGIWSNTEVLSHLTDGAEAALISRMAYEQADAMLAAREVQS